MTLYRILRQQDDNSFKEVGKQEASGASTANRRQADADGSGGIYLAVPESSWNVEEFEPQTTTRLRKIGDTARSVPQPLPGQSSLDDGAIGQTDHQTVAAYARSAEPTQ